MRKMAPRLTPVLGTTSTCSVIVPGTTPLRSSGTTTCEQTTPVPLWSLHRRLRVRRDTGERVEVHARVEAREQRLRDARRRRRGRMPRQRQQHERKRRERDG